MGPVLDRKGFRRGGNAMQGLDASVVTVGYSAVWGCFEHPPSHEPPKELSEKRRCVLREIPVLWHLLSCGYEHKKLKEQNFPLPGVTEQRTSPSLVATKGANSKQSPDNSHADLPWRSSISVSWSITFTLEKNESNLRSAPTSRPQHTKTGRPRETGNQSNDRLLSTMPESTNLPCWDATLPLPLLTTRPQTKRPPWAKQ